MILIKVIDPDFGFGGFYFRAFSGKGRWKKAIIFIEHMNQKHGLDCIFLTF